MGYTKGELSKKGYHTIDRRASSHTGVRSSPVEGKKRHGNVLHEILHTELQCKLKLNDLE